MDRQNPNFLLMCGPLSDQFWTDIFAKLESGRLLWLRLNQRQIRAENYSGLVDGLANDLDPSDMGRPVILPSNFTGGPRYMHEKAQDSMAIVRIHGRPDLFITLTCNPNWSEIQENLMRGQNQNDHHDLIARVGCSLERGRHFMSAVVPSPYFEGAGTNGSGPKVRKQSVLEIPDCHGFVSFEAGRCAPLAEINASAIGGIDQQKLGK